MSFSILAQRVWERAHNCLPQHPDSVIGSATLDNETKQLQQLTKLLSDASEFIRKLEQGDRGANLLLRVYMRNRVAWAETTTPPTQAEIQSYYNMLPELIAGVLDNEDVEDSSSELWVEFNNAPELY